MNCCKKWEKYFKKYPYHNALVSVLLGMGIGFLLTYPLAATHPVRWGLAFVGLGSLGHLWGMKD